MGQGKANPTGMILSAAMMWTGWGTSTALKPHGGASASSVRSTSLCRRIKPMEFGGSNGTADIAKAVLECCSSLST